MVQFGDCNGGTKTKAGNKRRRRICLVSMEYKTVQSNIEVRFYIEFSEAQSPEEGVFPTKTTLPSVLWILLPLHLHHHILSFTAFSHIFAISLSDQFFFLLLHSSWPPPNKAHFFFNHKKVFSELASVSLSCDCDSFATFFTSELLVGFITHNVVSQLLFFMLAIYSASYDLHFHSTWLNPTSQMQFISCLPSYFPRHLKIKLGPSSVTYYISSIASTTLCQ